MRGTVPVALEWPPGTLNRTQRNRFRQVISRRTIAVMSSESLLPLREVTSRLRILGEHYLGMREIPVDRSSARLTARSISTSSSARVAAAWVAVSTTFGRLWRPPVPPISVYEAGGLNFVIDGHHRVALSRQIGAAFIDAEVTQIDTSHGLHPGVDVLELVHTDQHRRFSERTGSRRSRPTPSSSSRARQATRSCCRSSRRMPTR